ncbi:MAG: hypothetical protein PHE83_04575 [Opitutaceae bacterium]|nr:hypothetical protein [Opitutaceae bacterium]
MQAISRRPGSWKLAVGGIGLLVVIGVAYMGYRRSTAVPVPPPKPVVVGKPAPTPVEAKPAAKPQTTLGQAVEKARETVAAVEANHTAPAVAVIRSETAPAPVAAQVTPSSPPAAPAASAVISGPNPEFRTFVEKLKIGGVRIGPPPRLLLEGVTYKPGDVIYQPFGIVFVGVDAKTKELLFKDDTGAVVRRRY